jgi:hypothetical protein
MGACRGSTLKPTSQAADASHPIMASVSDDSGVGAPPEDDAACPIEIRAALPKMSWRKVIGSILSESDEAWVEGSRWPSVIAINRFGQERQVLEAPTKKEALAQLSQVRGDLESLGVRRWCEKYDVPWTFVTG